MRVCWREGDKQRQDTVLSPKDVGIGGDGYWRKGYLSEVQKLLERKPIRAKLSSVYRDGIVQVLGCGVQRFCKCGLHSSECWLFEVQNK